MKEWKPPLEGRYKTGDYDSPIAICTTSSVDMAFPSEEVAIYGKNVTENLGIEKMVRNILSNPNIRYLIICGREAMGHFIDDALTKLIDNGVDKEGRIIGAKGGIPVVKNLAPKEIEKFRLQITLINMTGITDAEEVMKRARELKEFQMDSDYFIIYVKDKIYVEHYSPTEDCHNHLDSKFNGDTAIGILKTMNELGIEIKNPQHLSYMKRELAKAETALRENSSYEQE